MGKNQRVVDRLARLISNAARPPGPCVRTFIRPNCASTSPPMGTAWSHAPRIAFPATWLHIPVPRRPARGADTRGPRRYVGFYKDVHGPPMTFACRSSSEKKKCHLGVLSPCASCFFDSPCLFIRAQTHTITHLELSARPFVTPLALTRQALHHAHPRMIIA